MHITLYNVWRYEGTYRLLLWNHNNDVYFTAIFLVLNPFEEKYSMDFKTIKCHNQLELSTIYSKITKPFWKPGAKCNFSFETIQYKKRQTITESRFVWICNIKQVRSSDSTLYQKQKKNKLSIKPSLDYWKLSRFAIFGKQVKRTCFEIVVICSCKSRQ